MAYAYSDVSGAARWLERQSDILLGTNPGRSFLVLPVLARILTPHGELADSQVCFAQRRFIVAICNGA